MAGLLERFTTDSADELRHLGLDRPRAALVRTAVSLGISAGYLAVLAGTSINIVVAAHYRDFSTFVIHTGQLMTMILVWLGVGNVLSVAQPLRMEPLSHRRRDGTWKPYLLSFVTSYLVGIVVSAMLFWRTWTKDRLLDNLDSVTAITLFIVATALLSWIAMTLLAVRWARRPQAGRSLEREIVPYEPASTTGWGGIETHSLFDTDPSDTNQEGDFRVQ